MFARVGERSLANSRRRVPFRFTQRERLSAQLVLDVDLREALARRVVVVLGRLAGEFQRPLPDAVREVGDLRRHAGESSRVSFNPRTEIAPKAFEGTAEGVGRAAAQGLAHRFHRGPALRF
jgi:hypothetical protein